MMDSDPYHELRGRDRDHLLAAGLYAQKHDSIPSATDVQHTVGAITGSQPVEPTLYAALDALEAAELIERVEGEPKGNARGVDVTAAGYRALGRGAARLDAAATVEVDV